MPIRRFASLEDASRALWVEPGDSSLARTWNTLVALSRLAPDAPPHRGLKRFSSIEDANRDTDAWIARRVRAGRERVVPPH